MSRVVLLSAALMACPAAATAQTIITVEITSGTFNVDAAGPSIAGASFDLSGPGVHFVGTGVEPGNVPAATLCEFPGCQPGDTFTLDAIFAGSTLGFGSAVVNGLEFGGSYSGQLLFNTGEVTIPRGNRRHLTLSTRFTLGDPADPQAVFLNVHAGSTQQPPELRAFLSGTGTATAFFERYRLHEPPGPPEFFYNLVRVIYSFDTAATAQ